MSKYKVFRRRMSKNGSTDLATATRQNTKIVQRQRLYDSPSLRFVDITNIEKDVPVIISEDKNRVKQKRFLFLPDTDIKIGWLIEDRDKTYLALNRSDDDIYPQLFCELCNHDFVIKEEKREELKGYDELGNPIYKEEIIPFTVPSVLYTNVYSTLGNSTLSLPSGALVVRIPYKPEYLNHIHQNDTYKMNTGYYIITEISREYVFYEEEGFLEITLQRKVDQLS